MGDTNRLLDIVRRALIMIVRAIEVYLGKNAPEK